MKSPLFQFGCAALCLAAFLFLGFAYCFCWTAIDKGQVGVTSWFGKVDPIPLTSGPHWFNPIKRMYRMSVQTTRNEEPATLPTKSGLPVEVHAVMLYNLEPDGAPAMAEKVGHGDYESVVIDPVFKATIRDVAAEFEAEALYTAERSKVEGEILRRLQDELKKYQVTVQSVMLLDPVLPDVVKQRIEQKVGAAQDAERMKFVLQQKELEARAKVVEAKGIADAQAIIKRDLDENYLRYLWIEALKESAKHNNAVIYIPTGSDGMPFFRQVHEQPKR